MFRGHRSGTHMISRFGPHLGLRRSYLYLISISAVHIIFMLHSFLGIRWTEQAGLLPMYGAS